MPLLLVRSNIEPLVLLFTLGGILLVFFVTVRVLFKHSYGELLIGGGAFWLMSLLGLLQLGRSNLTYAAGANFALYFAAISITVIAGFTGLALVVNSSRESINEVTSAIGELAKTKPKSPRKRRRHKRR